MRRRRIKGQLFYPIVLLFAAIVAASVFTSITASILASYIPDQDISLTKMNVLGNTTGNLVP